MVTQYLNSTLEVLFVDDESTARTLDVIRLLKPPLYLSIRWLVLSRNFGKESALCAGFEQAHRNYVVTLDADLQDPPSLLPEMYDLIVSGGYDNVTTYRQTRANEPKSRSAFAHMFYKVINRISDIEIMDGARDFQLMNGPMVDSIPSLRERARFAKGIYSWVGFKTEWLPYDNAERIAGEMKWGFFSLFFPSRALSPFLRGRFISQPLRVSLCTFWPSSQWV